MKCRGYALPLLIFLFFMLLLAPSAPAQLIHISIDSPEQDRAFSEFNHHLMGVFLLTVGVMAFLSHASGRLSFLGKIWPVVFIIAGLYLALMSDPDLWPMGRLGWIEAFNADPEAAEHKFYSMLVIALGVLELERSRGKFGKNLARWSFPALAVFGAILLFFHRHNPADTMAGAMKGMENMQGMSATMMKVKKEHFRFALAGFGVAIFKFIYDGNFWKNRFLPFLWPSCIVFLGMLLILYSEA